MTNLIERLRNEGFVSLGYAKWVDGKGLQIENLDKIDPEAPGVYVMHHEGEVYKVGKSSAKLINRLKGYRGFDTPAWGKDASSVKQREAIKENGLVGMSVMFIQPKKTLTEWMHFCIHTDGWSFDAHDLEKQLKKLAEIEGHRLAFGSK